MPGDSSPDTAPDWEPKSEGHLQDDVDYPAIGRLFYRSDEGNRSWCSGTVIAQNMVLTAAHCVVNRINGIKYDSFSFVPGQEGSQSPYGTWDGGLRTSGLIMPM